MTNKEQKIVWLLPFFNFPKETIKINNIEIGKSKLGDIKKNYGTNYLGNSFTVGELTDLSEKRGEEWDEALWSVLVMENDDKISIVCYVAMLDLFTAHWKYVLSRDYILRNNRQLVVSTSTNPPMYSFNKTVINKFGKGIKLLSSKRFKIALQRWGTSYTREDALDSVLDCCSALEAVMSCESELRLRISLMAYHLVKENKKQVMCDVYKMYGIRSKFIHGSGIPLVTEEERILFIEIVANILKAIIRDQEIPKKGFLDKKIFDTCI